jgi:hypothetical protein
LRLEGEPEMHTLILAARAFSNEERMKNRGMGHVWLSEAVLAVSRYWHHIFGGIQPQLQQ